MMETRYVIALQLDMGNDTIDTVYTFQNELATYDVTAADYYEEVAAAKLDWDAFKNCVRDFVWCNFQARVKNVQVQKIEIYFEPICDVWTLEA